MMDPIPFALVFSAGALTFGSGYLVGWRSSFLAGHYHGVQDALDALDDGRADP